MWYQYDTDALFRFSFGGADGQAELSKGDEKVLEVEVKEKSDTKTHPSSTLYNCPDKSEKRSRDEVFIVQEVKLSSSNSQRQISHSDSKRKPSKRGNPTSAPAVHLPENPIVHLNVSDDPDARQSFSDSAISASLVSPAPTPP